MDPDKSPHLSSGRPASTRRMPSPSERVALSSSSAPAGPSQPSARLQTTLPPIHHLHPGLAHASMHPPPPPPRAGSPYSMSGATYPLPSTSTLGVRAAPEDSDPETSQGRQKQKRRRQALSCTECKRRKIKCDRANPCGPCVRRGEQAKCQWHVIEPMEKYVTRSEFDELKARVQELEATVMRGFPGMSPPAPASRRPSMSATMPMTTGHPAEPVHGTAIMPYSAYGAPYPPRPGSPRSPVRGEPPPPFYRHSTSNTGHSPTVSYRSHPMPTTPARAGPSMHHAHPRSPRSPVRTMSPRSTARPMSPRPLTRPMSPRSLTRPMSPRMLARPMSPGVRASPSVRRSSISLAEITSPYHGDVKPSARHPPPPPNTGDPKNRPAQTTPPPGHRLRTHTPPGPAHSPAPQSPHLRIHIVDLPLRRRVPV
ncbi:hypothetical protein C8Q78DRAFT_681208 [Trametes maxima]|nr:hypothetical protein C8Q78DRAFT_681208 [Trametes maxima]